MVSGRDEPEEVEARAEAEDFGLEDREGAGDEVEEGGAEGAGEEGAWILISNWMWEWDEGGREDTYLVLHLTRG